MGSKGHDLVGDSLMHLLTSSSVTGLKVLEAAGTKSGVSLRTCQQGFSLSYEPAEQCQRCDAVPSSMTATASWGPYYLQL